MLLNLLPWNRLKSEVAALKSEIMELRELLEIRDRYILELRYTIDTYLLGDTDGS